MGDFTKYKTFSFPLAKIWKLKSYGSSKMKALGIDVVDTARIQRLYKQHQERFTGLVLTEREAQAVSSEKRFIAFLAGRWAAKEAVMKALGKGIGDVSFTEIEILREESGAPSVVLHGRALDYAQAKGLTGWHVSISHERNVTVAVAAAQ
jgi:holo-[acyl-carrier protein] synthase